MKLHRFYYFALSLCLKSNMQHKTTHNTRNLILK